MDWSDLAEIYARCGGRDKTAAYYGVSTSTIKTEMRRRGIPARPIGQHDWPEDVRRKDADAQRGKVRTPETRAKQAASLSRTLARPEMKEQRRQALLRRLPSMGRHGVTSPLEKMLQNALLAHGISFTRQVPMLGRYVVDVLLRDRPVVIEADGAFHALPQGKRRDARRDADLQEAGYEVIHFSGRALIRDAYGCVEEMARRLGLPADPSPTMRDDRTPIMRHCDQCGAVIWRTPRRMAKSVRVFCDHRCKGDWQKANGYLQAIIPLDRRHRVDLWCAKQREIKRQSALMGNHESPAETTGPLRIAP